MAGDLATEGTVPFHVASIDTPCSTYYKVVGDLSCGSPPVVFLHGGPGGGHEYLLPFAELWPRYGLPVVFYDQIGCGASTRLPQTAGDKNFWREELFLAELNNLLDHLNLRHGPGFHLLGQSWGGMLGAAFAATRPQGLRRLILASALADQKLADRGVRLLREQMPSQTQRMLEETERKGDFDSKTYKEVVSMFYKKHVCRAEPFPPEELLPALNHLTQDTTVYGTMWVAYVPYTAFNAASPQRTVKHDSDFEALLRSRLPNLEQHSRRSDLNLTLWKWASSIFNGHFFSPVNLLTSLLWNFCYSKSIFSSNVLGFFVQSTLFLTVHWSFFHSWRYRYGPSFLNVNGSLIDWTCIPRLSQIAVPTLVYNGEHDTSHDICTAPFFEHIPRVRWITLPNAGHMCHLEGKEQRERVLRLVGEFLKTDQWWPCCKLVGRGKGSGNKVCN